MKEIITLADYWMGRDKLYPSELTEVVVLNATELVKRVNSLFNELCICGIKVSSGWRPSAINASIKNAAKKSNHMTGCAIDIADPNGYLSIKILPNLRSLEDCMLWLENPAATKGWVHLQSIPPKSGKRVFNP